MAWHTRYCQFPDETTARAVGAALGIDFPEDGSIPSGNQNYALHAPMQAPWATPPVVDGDGAIVTPGAPEAGYWAMLRLNDNFSGYAALDAQIASSGFVRELVDPPVVWA